MSSLTTSKDGDDLESKCSNSRARSRSISYSHSARYVQGADGTVQTVESGGLVTFFEREVPRQTAAKKHLRRTENTQQTPIKFPSLNYYNPRTNGVPQYRRFTRSYSQTTANAPKPIIRRKARAMSAAEITPPRKRKRYDFNLGTVSESPPKRQLTPRSIRPRIFSDPIRSHDKKRLPHGKSRSISADAPSWIKDWVTDIDVVRSAHVEIPELKPSASEADSDTPSDEPAEHPRMHKRSSSVTSLVEDAVTDREAELDAISELFRSLGHILIKNRIWYMGMIFVICVLLSPGFFYVKRVKYSYPFYINDSLETFVSVQKYEDAFGPLQTSWNTILRHNSFTGSENALTVEGLQSLHEAWTNLVNTEHDGYDFNSYCYEFYGHCSHPVSILSLWGYDSADLPTTNADIIRVVNQPSPKDTNGRLLELGTLLGGISRNESDMIVSATHLNLMQPLRDEPEGTFTSYEKDRFDWESSACSAAISDGADLRPFSEGCQFFEIWRAALESEKVLLFGILLLFFFGVAILSSPSPMYSRISVLFYSFICVGLAIFMTCCVWSFCGLPIIAEFDTIFYLLLGLGLDDCFVLVQDYHQENLQSSLTGKPTPMEQRIGRILSRGGVSITITSLTNALVFLIGYLSTDIDITKNYCLFAFFGVTCDWFLQVTLFPILVSFDGERQDANRIDILCCFKADPQRSCFRENPIFLQDLNHIQNKCMDHWIPDFVLSPWSILTTLTFTGTLIMAFFLLVGGLEPHFSNYDFLDEESYIADHLHSIQTHFNYSILNSPVLVISPESYTPLLSDLEIVLQKFANYPDVSEFDAWFYAYKSWMNDSLPINENQFLSTINMWLRTDGQRYAIDFEFEGQKVKSTKIHFFTSTDDSLTSQMKLREDLNAIIDEHVFLHGYVVCKAWIFHEATNQLYDNIIFSILFCMAAVFLCIMFLIKDFFMCVLITFIIVVTDLELCVWIYLFSIHLNPLVQLIVILTVGLIVDFNVHIAHRYINMLPEFGLKNPWNQRVSRVRRTLCSVGASVVNGATSTFLSTFVGAIFAPTKFVRDICSTFCMTVAIGCINALVLLPALLVLIPWANPPETIPHFKSPSLSARVLSLSPRSPSAISLKTIYECEEEAAE